jgi:hypothetical protein
MAAIREAVEANQMSLAEIDTDIMDLEDVVWRSPTRPVIDPTDIITRLAEEADKVARGLAEPPPPAAVYRSRSEPDFGTRRQVAARHLAAASSGETPTGERSTGETSAEMVTEVRIRQLVTAALKAEGRIDADGRINLSEVELRQLVRTQIDTFMAQQLRADQQDTLHSPSEMRTNAARDSGNDPD